MTKVNLTFKLEFISYLDQNRIYKLELKCESLFMIKSGIIYTEYQKALNDLKFEKALKFRNEGYINQN